jgi:two-component system CheB/CheR fusion protein
MRHLRVVVVDDNPDFAKSTGKLLDHLGHEAHIFDSGESALASLESLHPDLILSDIQMPGIDGYELARRVRQTSGMQDVVLAAITAHGDPDTTQTVIAAGFDYRFLKPLARGELQQFVEAVAGENGHSTEPPAK